MEINIKVSSKKINIMEKEHMFGKMEQYIKENIRMEKSMALEFYIAMDKNMPAAG